MGRWALRSGQRFQINAHLGDLKVALSDFIWTATLGVFLYELVQDPSCELCGPRRKKSGGNVLEGDNSRFREVGAYFCTNFSAQRKR